MKIERSAYLGIPAAVLPTRGLLPVAARDPFCDEHGLRLPFALDGDVPGGLNALYDVFHGGQPEACAHARAGRYGAGEAHAIQSVVDPQAHALDLDCLPHQVRQEGQREKAVRDGRSVRRFLGRALAVDVDPLVVVSRAGRAVDTLLAHSETVRHCNLPAFPLLDPGDAGDYDL